MSLKEWGRLDIRKIGYLKSIIHAHGEPLIKDLRQSPEERKAKINVHKHPYEKSYMEAYEQAQKKRRDKIEADRQMQEPIPEGPQKTNKSSKEDKS